MARIFVGSHGILLFVLFVTPLGAFLINLFERRPMIALAIVALMVAGFSGTILLTVRKRKPSGGMKPSWNTSEVFDS